MSLWIRKINQWNVWQRLCLLLFLLLSAHLLCYFCLEQPFRQRNHAVIAQYAQDQQLAQGLSNFSRMRENFVYRHDVGVVPFRQVFQKSLSGISHVAITNYVDHPVVVLSAGAMQFSSVASSLNIALSTTFKQSFATVLFSGKFADFVSFLQALQNTAYPIYFQSIDFNMNRYPNAEITLKVFSLEG